MNCPKCISEKKVKNGIIKGVQRYKCKDCGFNFTDPKGLIYKNIGDEMKHGNPTVINEYMCGPFNFSHTITILRIRQWKQTSNNIKVWFSDPACGTRIKKWNTTVGNNNFNKVSFLFLLH